MCEERGLLKSLRFCGFMQLDASLPACLPACLPQGPASLVSHPAAHACTRRAAALSCKCAAGAAVRVSAPLVPAVQLPVWPAAEEAVGWQRGRQEAAVSQQPTAASVDGGGGTEALRHCREALSGQC